jgi:hypothetical protein
MGRSQAAARRVWPGLVYFFRREPLGGQGGTAGRARGTADEYPAQGLAVWSIVGLLAVLAHLRSEAAEGAVALGQFRAPQGDELGYLGRPPSPQIDGLEGVGQGTDHAGADVRVAVSDVDDGAMAGGDVSPGACERGLVDPDLAAGEDVHVPAASVAVRGFVAGDGAAHGGFPDR